MFRDSASAAEHAGLHRRQVHAAELRKLPAMAKAARIAGFGQNGQRVDRSGSGHHAQQPMIRIVGRPRGPRWCCAAEQGLGSFLSRLSCSASRVRARDGRHGIQIETRRPKGEHQRRVMVGCRLEADGNRQAGFPPGIDRAMMILGGVHQRHGAAGLAGHRNQHFMPVPGHVGADRNAGIRSLLSPWPWPVSSVVWVAKPPWRPEPRSCSPGSRSSDGCAGGQDLQRRGIPDMPWHRVHPERGPGMAWNGQGRCG